MEGVDPSERGVPVSVRVDSQQGRCADNLAALIY